MQEHDRHLAVLTRELTKSFGSLKAVSGLNLSVEKGNMFGLVGPDGAGKSTVIRLLCGILSPSSGRGRIAGFDLETERQMIKRRIGYLSQNFTLYGDLTVDENIEFSAGIHNVDAFQERRDELLEFTRLTAFRRRAAGALSGGMKKKLALVCALIHTPEIIFLDEPSAGVDPVSRGELWNILASIMDRGVTIFMTTPYLDEAERCVRISLMHQGRAIMTGSPDEIKRAMPGRVYDLHCAEAPAAYRLLRDRLPATSLVLYGDHLRLWSASAQSARETAAWLGGKQIGDIVLAEAEPSLEDAFVALLGTKPPAGAS